MTKLYGIYAHLGSGSVNSAARLDFCAVASALLSLFIAWDPAPVFGKDLQSSYSEAKQTELCLDKTSDVPRILVEVQGIADDSGQIRVQIYNDQAQDFLVSGKKVLRVDVPTQSGQQKVCVTFPVEGRYAMAVLHDKNANGKVDIFSEGFGFSNNPRLLLAPPDHDKTLFTVGPGVQEMTVLLTYYFQLENKDQKRRKRQ